jgi:type III pantothenate kinase
VVVVDIGNSNARFALVEPTFDLLPICRSPVSIETASLNTEALDRLVAELQPGDDPWIVGSVQQQATQDFAGWFRSRFEPSRLHVLQPTDIPIRVCLPQPTSVGMDRLAAAFAAARLKPATLSAIVIDAGTAVTIDAVNAQGAFLGGTIRPGMALGLRSLASHTNQLPLLQVPRIPPSESMIGTDTQDAMMRGIYWGDVGAIALIVTRMQDELSGQSVVYLTGGGASLIQRHLPFPTGWYPDLVLQGLALAYHPS